MIKTLILLTLLACHLGLLTALAQPLITTPPQPQTKFAGESALLSVDATGTPPLSFQWFKASAPLAGQTSATLSLTNLQAADRGTYSVIVSDAAGPVTSDAVEVTVVTPPTITPANPTASLFADLKLTAKATPAGPVTYQWRFKGEPIAGEQAVTVTLTNIQKIHAGDYSVVAGYSFGAITSAVATLKITQFDNLYFFGGSWTDTGGNGCNWPAPRYYKNRACNGPMWPEFLSTNLNMTYVAANNRAYCGATSGDVLAQIGTLSATKSLKLSLFFAGGAVGDFLSAADANFPAPSGNVQYVPWSDEAGWNKVLQSALKNSSNVVEQLYKKGARTIVIQGVFDLGLTPSIREDFGNESDRFTKLTERTARFNSDLLSTLRALEQSKPDLRLHFVDFFLGLNELQSDLPGTGFTIVYPDALGDPALPDKSLTGLGSNYLYWDGLHVTSKAHQQIARWNLEVLEAEPQEKLSANLDGDTSLLRMNHLLVGRDYTLQQGTNIAAWSDVQTFTASAGTNQVRQTVGADTPAAFYRLQWKP